MARLWKNTEGTKEGKYLVKRRDGTVPEWPWFVLGARDRNSSKTLRSYANFCEIDGLDPQYVADIRAMADEWDEYRRIYGLGDSDAPPHRVDDPKTIEEMRKGCSA